MPTRPPRRFAVDVLEPRTLLTAGTLDPSFAGDGVAIHSLPSAHHAQVRDLILQPDGRVVVVGNARADAPSPVDGAAMRFNADGSLDETFGDHGVVTSAYLPSHAQWESAVLLDGGKLLLGGGLADDAGVDPLLARLNPDGTPDLTFGNGTGYVVADTGAGPIVKLAVLPTGRVLAIDSQGVTRYSADGSPDAAFGTAGRTGAGAPYEVDLAVLPDGRFYTASRLDPPVYDPLTFEANEQLLLARFNADGTPDFTFRQEEFHDPFAVRGIVVDAQGGLAVTGSTFNFLTRSWDVALLHYRPTGQIDYQWHVDVDGDGAVETDLGTEADWGDDVVIQPDGKYLVAAHSGPESADGQDTGGKLALIRITLDFYRDAFFGTNGTMTFDFAAGADQAAALGLLPDGKVVVAGSATIADPRAPAGQGQAFAVARAIGLGASADAGGPYAVDEGGSVTLAATGSSAPGRTITAWEWDLYYDGVTFRPEATGQSVVFSARDLDGTTNRVVALRVTDSAGDTALDTADLQIRNVRPTITLSGAPTGREGEPYTLTFTATDPGPDTIGGWSIKWGDGATDNFPGDRAIATHVYATGRNRYTITASAFDEDGNYTGPLAATLPIVIEGTNDAPVLDRTALRVGPPVVNEGQSASVTGRFTDPDTADSHTVTINWGDGTTDSVFTLKPGELSFTSVVHVYRDDNPTGTPEDANTITVTVSDGTASDTATLGVTVRNVAPTLGTSGPSVTPEGLRATFSAVVNDPAGALDTFTYAWELTGPSGAVVAAGSDKTFIYTPPDDGTYEARLKVTDDDGGIAAVSRTWTVTNVKPAVAAAGPASVPEGSLYTLNLSSTDPGADTIRSWTIDWGEGLVETLPGNPPTARHRYADGPHGYVIGVTAEDEDGRYSVAATTGVTPPPPGADPTFGGGTGLVDTGVRQAFWNFAGPDVAQAPDGKLLVVGDDPDGGGWKVQRLNADGSVDAAFGTGGFASIDFPGYDEPYASSVAVQADGKVVVGGSMYSADYRPFVLVRFNRDGALDTAFGNDGIVVTRDPASQPYGQLHDVAVLPDGKILAGGFLSSQFALARYNPDGSPDISFGKDGVSIAPPMKANYYGWAYAMALAPDGKIVLAGEARYFNNGQEEPAVARFNADGSIDTTFGNAGSVILTGGSELLSVGVQKDGKVVAGGWVRSGPYWTLYRLNVDGTRDTSFAWTGSQFTEALFRGALAEAIIPQADGGVVVAGDAWHDGPGEGFLRFRQDGSLDTTFGTGGRFFVPTDVERYTRGYAIQSDGKLVSMGGGRLYRFNLGTPFLSVANVPPQAAFGAGLPVRPGEAATVAFRDPFDPSAPDLAAGLRHSYDFNNDGDFTDPGEAENVREPFRSVTFASPGVYTVHGRISDKDGGSTDYTTEIVVGGSVIGRHVIYLRSAFDLPGPSAAPAEAAIATDKVALLPGQEASFANVISYVRGVNGIVVDLPAGTGELTAADFEFRTGVTAADPSNAPGSWVELAAPVTVSRAPGAGASGSDRVTLSLPDGSVVNRWLQVTVKSNERTGLARPDVFYFGSLVGETGNAGSPGLLAVNALDQAGTKQRLNTAADVTNRFDFNRDGRVNSLDLTIAKRAFFSSLPLITALPEEPAAAARVARVADEVLR